MYRLELEKRGNKVSLLKESVVQIFDPSILVLSLACYPSFDLTLEGFPSVIAVSASDGQIVLFDYMRYISADRAQILGRSQAHSLEAWTVVWASSCTAEDKFALLYSGGDDSALCKHRSSAHPLKQTSMTARKSSISRSHYAVIGLLIAQVLPQSCRS